MSTFFTRPLKSLLLFVCCFLFTATVMAQYTATNLETSSTDLYSGIAKDAAGNIYVVKPDATTPKYDVVKYINGTPSTIFTGLISNDGEFEYPFGITVVSNGDVYVVDGFDDANGNAGKIYKLHPTGPTTYTSSVFTAGNFYTAITHDASDNLFTMEYNGVSNNYDVVKYPAGSAAGASIYDGLTLPAGIVATQPWGLVVDNNNNIYFTTFHEGSPGFEVGGDIVRLAYPSYTATKVQTGGNGYTSLAVDASNNLYTLEASATAGKYDVRKYTSPATVNSAGTVIYSGLTDLNNPPDLPIGLAVLTDGTIYANDVVSTTPFSARIVKLSPPTITVTSINRAIGAINPTNATSLAYTVVYSGNATGVAASNFSLTTLSGTVASTGITVATISQSAYTVTATGVTGNGVARLDMINATGITPPVTNTPFITGQTFTVDNTAPTVSSVSVPANGSYKAGAVLSFTVNFSEAVTVIGTPQLPITIGSTVVNANYVSGSGSTALVFTYTVVSGDNDNNGIALGTSLILNGGTIKDAATNSATLTLNGAPSTAGILIDTNIPTVVLTPAPTGPVNAPFNITITFSEPVFGLAQGDVNVTNGTTTTPATSDNITFTATITPTADGAVTVQIPVNAAQDAANNGNAASNTLNYTYDHTPPAAPVITGLNTGSNPSNVANNVLKGTAEANSTVTLYRDGSGSGFTTPADGSGNWTFTTGALSEGTHTYIATATDAATNVSTNSNTYSLVVDLTAPTVVSVDVPANGSYKAGTVLTFVIHMSEVVNVTGGNPTIPVTIGATTIGVPYASGTGTNTLTFSYTVLNGQNDNDGITVGTNLMMNGSSVQDAAQNNMNTAFNNVGSTTEVFVDTDAPTTTISTTSPALVNAPFSITITFSEAVIGFTTGGIIVSNGAASNLQTTDNITYTATITPAADGGVNVNVAGGAAQDVATNDNIVSNTLVFTYDHTPPAAPVITGLQTGSNPSNSATNTLTGTAEANSTVNVSRDGGTPVTTTADGIGNWTFVTGTLAEGTYAYTATATDAAGNTGLVSNTYNLTIDLTAPTVTSVTVPANGSYKAGTNLTFTVNFSEAVNVTGTPQLALTIGSNTVNANYVSGSGTNALTFTYTVVAGDNDADGITVGTLTLNGGTIKDAAGNDATLTLNSVGSTTGVLVDTNAPTVIVSSSTTFPTNAAFPVTITFSEVVNNFTLGGITVTNGTASNLQTTDNITYTATISPGGTTGDVTITAAAAQDNAGNDNTVSNTYPFTFDNTPPAAPVITGLQTGSNPSNSATNTLTGTAEANSTVNVSRDGGTPVTTTADGSGNWTFATGILGDGTYAFTATATDVAGNTGAVSNTYNLTIDLTAPIVTSVAVPAAGSYKVGTNLTFTVNFSEAVTVTGTPQLALTIGSNTVNANYVSGSGTNALTFTYTVVAGDNDADGITVGTLTLNGGTIKDAAGNDATLTLNSVGSTTGVLVDTDAPTVVLSSATTFPTNAPFTLTITFSEHVNNLTLAGFSVTNGTASNLQTTDNITYTATISPAGTTGDVTVTTAAAQDNAGNDNTVSNTYPFTFDNTPPAAPVITGLVTGTSPSHIAINTLQGTAEANSTVNVSIDGNTPIATSVDAGGNWTFTTNTLTDGSYNFTATATDVAGNTGAVSNTYNLVVDLTVPTVVSVDAPSSGDYTLGNTLIFNVHFSENVTVTGTPQLPVTIGSTVVNANYTSGSGGTSLIFAYAIQAGDNDPDGITVGSALLLNGGTIQDAATNDATLTLNGVASTAGVLVDTDPPGVVLSTTATSPTNAPFTIAIAFSEHVNNFTAAGFTAANATVSNLQTADGIHYTATITPATDGPVTITVPANVAQDDASNNNTASNTLNFVYDATPPAAPVITGIVTGSNPSNSATNTLQGTAEANSTVNVSRDGNTPVTTTADAGGNWTFPTGTLADGTYNFTATATDAAGNTSAVSNTYSLTIDVTAPVVTSVDAPSSGDYRVGNTLIFNVHLSENVTVTGTPQLPVTIGSTVVNATYTSGSGSSSLIFVYAIQAGDNDADGVTVGSALTLNGGTIKDAAGNDATLTLNNVAGTTGVLVDTNVPTVVLSSSAPALVNTPIGITITFSEVVNNFTAAGITVTNGTAGNLQTADNITYTAVITPAADGAVTITVPAAAAQDNAANDNTASNILTYNYDATAPAAPVISGLSAGNNPSNQAVNTLAGTAEANSTITVTQNNSVVGTTATDAGGNWTFTTSALTDGTYIYTATAKDAAGNVSPVSNSFVLNVDLTAPTVTSVSVPVASSYKAGTVLNFTVNFSENVTVTGTPDLPVTIGSTAVNAAYTGGSGTNALTFAYTVQPGDNDNDGITTGTALNGGTIADAAGNNANLTLNNVGSTSGVLVDTNIPTVVLSSAATSPVNSAFSVTVVFSEAVNGFTAAGIQVTNGTAGNLQTTDNITYTATITPTADGTVTVTIPASVAADAATNPNTASNTLTYTYDGTAPTITSVSVPANKTYIAGEVLSFTTQFSEAVTITGTPSLDIVIGSTTHALAMQGSTAASATFTYTVQAGDADADGITLPAALTLNGATIKDAAGNNALLTLNNAGSTTGVKVDAVAPVIDANQAFTAVQDNVAGTVIGTITGNDPAGGGTLQQWTFVSDDASGAGLAAFTLNGTTGEITVSNTTILNQHINETITFHVTVSDGYNTSTLTDVKVKIDPKFLAPTDITLSNNTVNDRSPVHTPVGTLTTTTAQPAVTFTYTLVTGTGSTDNAAFTISGSQLQTNAAIDYATKSSYTVRIRATDNNGQSFEKAFAITVNFVNQAPVINTIADASVCGTTDPKAIAVTGISAVEAGQTYTLAVSADQPYFDQLTITPGTAGTATISYTEKANVSGPVHITVTVVDNGGTANGGADTKTTTFTLTIAQPPVITITSDVSLSISKGDIVHLTANADDGAQFAWTGTTGIISGESLPTLTVRPLVSASYEVTVTSSNGCPATQSVSIDVSSVIKQNALNILTPNGDGQNDHWIVKNIDLFPNNEVKVFDRTGRIVYDKKVYTNDWDGTVNGQPLAEGTYYYIIDYGPGLNVGKGYITIIRDKY